MSWVGSLPERERGNEERQNAVLRRCRSRPLPRGCPVPASPQTQRFLGFRQSPAGRPASGAGGGKGIRTVGLAPGMGRSLLPKGSCREIERGTRKPLSLVGENLEFESLPLRHSAGGSLSTPADGRARGASPPARNGGGSAGVIPFGASWVRGEEPGRVKCAVRAFRRFLARPS
jgi:hypothetical protein